MTFKEAHERFMIIVGWEDGCDPMRIRGRVSADSGYEIPDPPPTSDEMQEVALAAKMAMRKVLRRRASKR
jgi:hypothetical protein